MHKIFRFSNFSETLKGSPTKIFGTVRQKNSGQKKVIQPLPRYIHIILLPEVYETQDGSPMKFLGTMREKILDRELYYPSCPLLTHEVFQYPNFFETQKGSQRNFLAP